MSLTYSDLRRILREVRETGVVTATGDLDDVRRWIRLEGWDEMPVRSGEPPVAEIRPTRSDSAHPRSLSAEHGMGKLPLHTDGAHLPFPPDLLVLSSSEPNGTATVTWTIPKVRSLAETPWKQLDHGIFLVRNGSESFFTAAAHRGGIRYDPGCMKACDERSVEVEEFFADLGLEAIAHKWTESDSLLFVDNRRTLHGRATVEKSDSDRVLQRIAFLKKRAP